MKNKDNFDSSFERVSLKPGDEISAFYRELRRDVCNTTIVLERTDGKKIGTSFPTESLEAEIIRKALRCVKRGIKIRILRLADPKAPIRVLKIPNLHSKKGTRYLRVASIERLEPFTPPGKPPETGLDIVLNIVENRETIVAVVYQKEGSWEIECNRMKHFGKPEENLLSHARDSCKQKTLLEKLRCCIPA